MFNERWYQTAAIESIFNYYDAGNKGNPVIAMPTASGKTHVITGFLRRVLNRWPRQRFLVTTHVKELIQQNADKLQKSWSHAPYGIHSAGLKEREFMQPIIIGGVQSMYKNAEVFGHRDIAIVDEAHLVSPKDGTMYQQLFKTMKEINPYFKVIGLSATIYRQSTGLITEPGPGQIFTDIAYDLTEYSMFNRLIAEGWLAPLFSQKQAIEIDVSNVSISNNGDFNQKQLQEAANRERITHAALTAACKVGYNRRSWLVFAAGIEHAENITAMLNSFGVPTVCVHSKLKDPKERDRLIEAHKRGEARCMVGNNIFTTGYDHPPLDLIIDLQPTMSVAKHVQKYGRGMRISPETYKSNCIVMDFAGNTRRNGPINDPYIPSRRKKKTGDAPVKVCEECGTQNHPSVRFCEMCGAEFEFKTKIVQTASDEEPLKSEAPIVEYFDVNNVFYSKIKSNSNGLPMMKVTYFSGLQQFTELVMFEHGGYAGKRARDWWRQRHKLEPPDTVDQALQVQSELKVPTRIRVWVNKKYPEVLGVEF